jgi:hypothetical protein
MGPTPDDEGMGGTPRGPSFTFGQPAQPPGGFYSQPPISGPSAGARPLPPRHGPPKSRLPGVLTALAVLAVATVTAVGTLIAYRNDSQVTTPAPTSAASSSQTAPSPDTIDFTAIGGAGRLVVLSHSWNPSGLQSIPGSYLRLEIQLVCTDGEIDYDPYHFQAFDARGDLYDVSPTDSAQPQLGIGTLDAGQSVRGFIGFEIPRGEVTLLMSSDSSGAVTAIKIRD